MFYRRSRVNFRRTNRANGTLSEHSNSLEGYTLLSTSRSLFELDLLVKNLSMNGISVRRRDPDPTEPSDSLPALLVRTGQVEQALALIASMELTDFMEQHDQ